MGWDKDAAVQWAKNHAQPHSTSFCARYVARAVVAGGVRVTGANALDFGGSLRVVGFTEMSNNTEPVKGDIAVIQPIPGHPYGHTAIYDGESWYSDFKQRTMYPGSAYRALKPDYKIYRML